MKRDIFPARAVNFLDALFLDESAGMTSSVRSRRRSRVFRRPDCDFLMLIATNISTCSRLSSKSSGGLLAGWRMSGCAILLAPGENHRASEWDVGYSGLV